MTLVLMVLLGWVALSVLGTLGAAVVCRSGHLEDVARGFAEPEPDLLTAPEHARPAS